LYREDLTCLPFTRTGSLSRAAFITKCGYNITYSGTQGPGWGVAVTSTFTAARNVLFCRCAVGSASPNCVVSCRTPGTLTYVIVT
jgi:hypothetical protein